MVALIACHEVEGVFAETALPRNSLIPPIGREALRFLALIAHDVAAIKSALAAAYRSHAVLDKVHEACAFEAEKVVQFIRTLLALNMLKEFKGELVAEHKEVSVTGWALDEWRLGPL